MRTLSCTLPLLAMACRDPDQPVEEALTPVDLLSRVDPRIGSGGLGFAVGSGFPGAARPFGLVKASPDTADQYGSYLGAYRGGGYHADDTYIRAFSHTHLYAVGLTDYGHIGVLPMEGFDRGDLVRDAVMAPFDRSTEVSRPGYYAVSLQDSGLRAELSATAQTALHRYTFPAGAEAPTLRIDLAHGNGDSLLLAGELEIDGPAGRLRGTLLPDGDMAPPFPLWFEAIVEPPPVSWGTWTDAGAVAGSSAASAADPALGTADPPVGVQLGAWLRFDQPVISLRLALSAVDAEGAADNLEAEHDGFDLAAAEQAAREEWSRWLSPLRVYGGSERDQIILASALYHCLMMPTRFSDPDGRYRGFDGQIHQDLDHAYHSDHSLWDTYRNTHPLYTLLWPEAHLDLLASLAHMTEQGGAIPRWPNGTGGDGGFMLGNPGHVVVAEALQKGLSGFGEELLVPHAVEVALGRLSPPYAAPPDPLRQGELGYYAHDEVGASVAWTQEKAIADHALAQLGPELVSEADRAALQERAGYWRNLYDPDVGYFHGRLADGSFADFNSDEAWLEEYTEGNARQYLWLVPHDPEGLFELLGGPEAAVERLDWLFERTVTDEEVALKGLPRPYYWHGNEVGLHTAWLYALAGRPDLSRQWLKWISAELYSTGPDGLAGNDDGGALSAWFVWTSLGLYPLAGTDRYVLGEPRFPRVELDLAGEELVIERIGHGPIEKVELDGQPWTAPDLRHADLMGARSLRFVGAE